MQIWLAIGVLFLVIELLTINLVTIWFAIGAFVTMFFFKFSFLTQIVIFCCVSLIFIALLRGVVMEAIKKRDNGLERIVEKKVIVEKKEERGPDTVYTVYLDGKEWGAISENNFNIGDEGIVITIKGNKLIIKKEKEDKKWQQ